tara:strand:- start:5872 stop:6693 length:822 start_codon:yes stop_codon:yes gene_type:complete
MTNKDLLISIVVYGTNVEELDNAIRYMNLKSVQIKHDLIIIDNKGDKKTEIFCLKHGISYVNVFKNVGFGAGHNLASKYFNFSHEIQLILNPDVLISDKNINDAFNFIHKNKDISLLSPKLLNEDGSIQYICRFLPSPMSLIKRFFSKVFNLKINSLEDKLNLTNDHIEVPSIHGACFFVRSTSLESINGFDERYFLYVEDIDLCRELSEYGSITYLPSCYAIHGHQRGSYSNLNLFKYHLKSFIYYFIKWGLFFDKKRNIANNSAIKKCNSI